MIYPELPERAISIMQPWAWLIVNGHKDIENRDWPTRFRGPVAIHAGKKVDKDTEEYLGRGWHPARGRDFDVRTLIPPQWEIGGIVGVAEIVDCIDASESDWFVGKYGFVIRNARPVPFIPCKGALSFFDWRRNL